MSIKVVDAATKYVRVGLKECIRFCRVFLYIQYCCKMNSDGDWEKAKNEKGIPYYMK